MSSVTSRSERSHPTGMAVHSPSSMDTHFAGGLPKWIDGIADTGCIATHGSAVAIADRTGNLFLSGDNGYSWSRPADGLPLPSSVLIA